MFGNLEWIVELHFIARQHGFYARAALNWRIFRLCKSIAPVPLFSDGDGGTPSLFVQAANLWYDIRDTYIVRFVADGCRKNLPLCDLPRWHFQHISSTACRVASALFRI